MSILYAYRPIVIVYFASDKVFLLKNFTTTTTTTTTTRVDRPYSRVARGQAPVNRAPMVMTGRVEKALSVVDTAHEHGQCVSGPLQRQCTHRRASWPARLVRASWTRRMCTRRSRRRRRRGRAGWASVGAASRRRPRRGASTTRRRSADVRPSTRSWPPAGTPWWRTPGSSRAVATARCVGSACRSPAQLTTNHITFFRCCEINP